MQNGEYKKPYRVNRAHYLEGTSGTFMGSMFNGIFDVSSYNLF